MDYFFLVVHTSLIAFNLLGWIWKPLRTWHLGSILLTFASWGLLGIWYGFGYCPFTEWHWNVLEQMGVKNLPNSYISYLLQRLVNVHPAENLVDAVTLGSALLALMASIWVNFFLVGRRASRKL